MLAHQSELELSEVEDTAELGLRFKNGVMGSVHLNYYQQPYSHWLEIIGSKGTLRWNDRDGHINVYTAEDEAWEENVVRTEIERNDLFLSELKHFIAVALNQFEPICDLDDGIHVQKIIAGAKESVQNAKIVSFS
jgi:predicted dehydrogenase